MRYIYRKSFVKSYKKPFRSQNQYSPLHLGYRM